MPVIEKIKRKLKKPVSKELLRYGIENEIRRFVGKGKKIVPRLIPFVNNRQLDVTEALIAQGIRPAAYSTPATQFVTPQGLIVDSNSVRKIPLKTPQDSLFYMHSVRYWALHESDDKWPMAGQNATIKNTNYFYDKFNKTTKFPGRFMSSIVCNGTSGVPSSTVNPSPLAGTFDTRVIYNRMLFIMPLYADDVVNPLANDPDTSKDSTYNSTIVYPGYIQLEAVGVNAASFILRDMSSSVFSVAFSGETPVFWPMAPGGRCSANDPIIPYWHFLKVALIANSPKKINIYGQSANVPAVNDPMSGLPDTQQNFNHIERLYTTTLQGINDGYNQVERKHLFPIDSTINIEIENIFEDELLVNGYVFGYQIFERGN